MSDSQSWDPKESQTHVRPSQPLMLHPPTSSPVHFIKDYRSISQSIMQLPGGDDSWLLVAFLPAWLTFQLRSPVFWQLTKHSSLSCPVCAVEAIHLGSLIAAQGYIFPISDHVLTMKDDSTFYRFQVGLPAPPSEERSLIIWSQIQTTYKTEAI